MFDKKVILGSTLAAAATAAALPLISCQSPNIDDSKAPTTVPQEQITAMSKPQAPELDLSMLNEKLRSFNYLLKGTSQVRENNDGSRSILDENNNEIFKIEHSNQEPFDSFNPSIKLGKGVNLQGNDLEVSLEALKQKIDPNLVIVQIPDESSSISYHFVYSGNTIEEPVLSFTVYKNDYQNPVVSIADAPSQKDNESNEVQAYENNLKKLKEIAGSQAELKRTGLGTAVLEDNSGKTILNVNGSEITTNIDFINIPELDELNEFNKLISSDKVKNSSYPDLEFTPKKLRLERSGHDGSPIYKIKNSNLGSIRYQIEGNSNLTLNNYSDELHSIFNKFLSVSDINNKDPLDLFSQTAVLKDSEGNLVGIFTESTKENNSNVAVTEPRFLAHMAQIEALEKILNLSPQNLEIQTSNDSQQHPYINLKLATYKTPDDDQTLIIKPNHRGLSLSFSPEVKSQEKVN